MTRVASASDVRVVIPTTLEEAVDLIAGEDDRATPLAGGTWVMRGAVRGDGFEPTYALVSRLPELRVIDRRADVLSVGAAVTHQELADALAKEPSLRGLAVAAARSANPAIRRVATVGGNLATTAFAAGDLVPALIAAGAEVQLMDAQGARVVAISEFLASRTEFLGGALLTHVRIPLGVGLSAHERLTLRRGGDYPVAIADVYVELDGNGVVQNATVAIGSVEAVARGWPSLADRLIGSVLDVGAAEFATRELCSEIHPRDGVEASGWYRLQVLPTVVGRAIRTLQTAEGR